MNILKQDFNVKQYIVNISILVEHSVILNLIEIFSSSCVDGSIDENLRWQNRQQTSCIRRACASKQVIAYMVLSGSGTTFHLQRHS